MCICSMFTEDTAEIFSNNRAQDDYELNNET